MFLHLLKPCCLFLILFSWENLYAQEGIDKTLYSTQEFEKVSDIFKDRFVLFKKEKIKFENSFIDSLFNIQQWAKKEGNEHQRLMADYYAFIAYDHLIDDDKILEEGNKLLAQKKFLTYPESSFTARAVFSAYFRKGYYSKQLEFYPFLKELNARHNYNVRDKNFQGYQELAKIYYNIHDYERARYNYQKQLTHFLNEGDLFMIASMHNNIALTYEKQDDFENAFSNYHKSLDYIEKDKEGWSSIKNSNPYFSPKYRNHFKNVVASNIASLQMKMQNYQGVEEIFLAEIESSKKVNTPRITIQGYTNISEAYLLKGKVKLSKIYMDSALVFSNSFKNPSLLSRIYEVKAKYMLSQDSLLEAEKYFLKSSKIRDSINIAIRVKGFEEATLKFDLDLTQDQLENSRKLIERKNQITLLLWIILIIIFLATILFFIQLLRIKKKNKDISENKEELSKALKTNKTLLEEIHHRIKNNLQVISGILELKSLKMKDDDSINVMRETQKYIESMSFIHEHLYPEDSEAVINMQSYLDKLSHAVISNYDLLIIEVNIQAEGVVLNVQRATPLGLMVCELITNSAKHAFEHKGKINIELIQKDDLYLFYYSDNGKGFTIDADRREEHIGMNLMDMLIEELNAQSKQYIDNGFHIELQFN